MAPFVGGPIIKATPDRSWSGKWNRRSPDRQIPWLKFPYDFDRCATIEHRES
jgi:hypothetical protein